MKLIKYSAFLPLLSVLSFTAGIMFSNQTYSSSESFLDVAMRYFPEEAASKVKTVVFESSKSDVDATLNQEARELFSQYPKQFLEFLNELTRMTVSEKDELRKYASSRLVFSFRFFINKAFLIPEIEKEALQSLKLYQATPRLKLHQTKSQSVEIMERFLSNVLESKSPILAEKLIHFPGVSMNDKIYTLLPLVSKNKRSILAESLFSSSEIGPHGKYSLTFYLSDTKMVSAVEELSKNSEFEVRESVMVTMPTFLETVEGNIKAQKRLVVVVENLSNDADEGIRAIITENIGIFLKAVEGNIEAQKILVTVAEKLSMDLGFKVRSNLMDSMPSIIKAVEGNIEAQKRLVAVVENLSKNANKNVRYMVAERLASYLEAAEGNIEVQKILVMVAKNLSKDVDIRSRISKNIEILFNAVKGNIEALKILVFVIEDLSRERRWEGNYSKFTENMSSFFEGVRGNIEAQKILVTAVENLSKNTESYVRADIAWSIGSFLEAAKGNIEALKGLVVVIENLSKDNSSYVISELVKGGAMSDSFRAVRGNIELQKRLLVVAENVSKDTELDSTVRKKLNEEIRKIKKTIEEEAKKTSFVSRAKSEKSTAKNIKAGKENSSRKNKNKR